MDCFRRRLRLESQGSVGSSRHEPLAIARIEDSQNRPAACRFQHFRRTDEQFRAVVGPADGPPLRAIRSTGKERLAVWREADGMPSCHRHQRDGRWAWRVKYVDAVWIPHENQIAIGA